MLAEGDDLRCRGLCLERDAIDPLQRPRPNDEIDVTSPTTEMGGQQTQADVGEGAGDVCEHLDRRAHRL